MKFKEIGLNLCEYICCKLIISVPFTLPVIDMPALTIWGKSKLLR